MTPPPLVSCIMPTADRRRYIPLALDYFLRQDYPERELVVIDDGTDSVEDLIPDDARLRYFRIAPGLTLGAKRNLACEHARGDVIAHWDDDDWHAPRRLTLQLDALLASGAELCGINRLLFYEPAAVRAWEYAYPSGQRAWLSGSTLVYRRRFWETHRFANVSVGEDAKFVWGGAASAMHVLDDHTFHVGMVHARNTSPKRTRGRWWREIPAGRIHDVLGADYASYGVAVRAPQPVVVTTRPPLAAAPPRRNVFACLVHESPDCVVDLVRNLRHLDPGSEILLYNGGADPALLANRATLEQLGAIVHPAPRAAKWGTLHGFALECMRYALRSLPFDTLTIVDSDQLALRAGYSARLGAHLAGQDGVGMLVNRPEIQPRGTRVPPAVTAWREVELWRPFLRRFAAGESQWVHWSFWPSTVFTADACRALLDLFDRDEQLRDILATSRLWATEEILFPTLTALLGFRVVANPCSYDFVRYKAAYSVAQLGTALRCDDVYWMHPVPRRYRDLLRHHVRHHFGHYYDGSRIMTTGTADTDLLLTLPLLAEMKRIEGWLEEDEADLLIAAVRAVCRGGQPLGAIVEVGSYCGRSTVVLAKAARACARDVRVYAVDPHDGLVGAADQGLRDVAPSRDRFLSNLASAGVADVVELVQQRSWEVAWSRPIGLLFVDGLHDYENVARDFTHFEPHLAPGACVAFHDYADYYPGVRAFVDELAHGGRYEIVQRVRSMILLRRAPA